ncbi:AAA domain-containing protein [Desulfitobacterium sp. LBE]|uniref:ParA family protein n=1 Tax=Desulfitobacterium sp. LBE TaxID=884086 RepID=UPI00119AF7E0|nr:AAA family ATPase [Desulfitobacterium sp. LBE]TWH59312.1 AAA domain-containing protein [Desulfitobacterium sp. LBE]
MQNNGKQILAVWGSPNSCKTVTAIKLAKMLSDRKKNVMLILCDDICPVLPTVYKSKDPIEVSLGEVLSAPNITQEVILRNCLTLEKNPYLSVLGYKAGENPFSYAEYNKERAIDLLVLLRHIVDYVVIDCSSILTENIISTAALEVADEVIRMGSCDLKSISYFMSILPLISDSKFGADKHIKVLSNVRQFQSSDEYRNAFSGVSYSMPYVRSLEEQSETLTLFEELTDKGAKGYEAIIKEIIKEAFGDE